MILAATIVASLGLGDRAFGFLRFVPGGDVTGHFGLYAALGFTFVGWIAGSRPPAARRRTAWRLAGVLALLVALEEASQSLLASRTASLLDLAASLGGLAVGTAAATWWRQRREKAAAAPRR